MSPGLCLLPCPHGSRAFWCPLSSIRGQTGVGGLNTPACLAICLTMGNKGEGWKTGVSVVARRGDPA